MSHKAHVNEKRTKNTDIPTDRLPAIAAALGVTDTFALPSQWCDAINAALGETGAAVAVYCSRYGGYGGHTDCFVTMSDDFESAYPDDDDDRAALNKIAAYLDPDFVLAFTSEYDDIWEYAVTPNGVICTIVA